MALLVSVLAACGRGEENGPSAGEIVTEAADATSAVKSFHFVFTSENVKTGAKGLSLTSAEGDIVVPDRLQAEVGGTFLRAPLQSELVVISGSYWLKDPFTGRWRTIDVDLNPISFFDPAKGVLSVVEGATELTVEGEEPVGGVDCHRVSGKVPLSDVTPLLGNEPSDELVPVELWIGRDDALLRRIRVTGKVLSSDGDDAVRTVELSRHDEPVTIEPPD